MKQNYKKILR